MMSSECVYRVSAILPGPTPTPVLSPGVMLARGSLDRMAGDWAGGELGAGGGGMESPARREDMEAMRRGL